MWFFGRKTNGSSTTPSVPPELQAYYDTLSVGGRVRHSIGRLMPMIIAVVLAGGIVGAAVLIREHRSPDTKLAISSNSGTSKRTPTTSQPSTSSNNSSPSGTPTLQVTQPTSGSQRVVTTPTLSVAIPATMPNTGPAPSILIIPILAGMLTAGLNYGRQFRSSKR